MVSRVFEDIYKQYSDIYKLAQAKQEELHEFLLPLGMSKRVPFLIKAGRYICNSFNGIILEDVTALMKIPGMGIYTATAVATFAYGQSLVPIDVNILRFLSCLTGPEMKNKTKGSKALRDLTVFLSENYTSLKAEHLLDFTRLICKPRNPRCNECPLTKRCDFYPGGK